MISECFHLISPELNAVLDNGHGRNVSFAVCVRSCSSQRPDRVSAQEYRAIICRCCSFPLVFELCLALLNDSDVAYYE